MNNSPYNGIVSSKYDGTLDYPITMYDNLPYQRDSDYCNAEKLTLQSGKIIKYYLCMNQVECFPINNRDDEIESILAAIQAEELKRVQTVKPEPVPIAAEDGITPEQIQTLLEDQDNETDTAEPMEVSASTNPFEGIEDW